jgi:hypothetical protein
MARQVLRTDPSPTYTHFIHTSMIRPQYMYVASKNFISNRLRHIVLFNIINVPINHKLYISGILYFYTTGLQPEPPRAAMLYYAGRGHIRK